MSTCWRPLKLDSTNDRLPPLLISCTFTRNSYTVHVTDLTNVWSESLEKRAIERRSEDEETSINPVNDTEQLKILLRKLDDGLTGKPNTALSLSSRKGRNRSDPASLVLNITANLPKPLKPLKWPVQLQYTNQSVLTAHLTVPLIKAQNSRLKELELLIELLKDKDHVIQRLVDKLETTGADLASVFAGAAGKNGKVLPRNQAEERVKGLKPFDVTVWRKSTWYTENSSGPDPVRQVLEEVFDENTSVAFGAKIASDEPVEWEDWWQNLGEITLELSASPHVIRSTKRDLKTNVESDQDDDFQVQATPPPHDGVPDKKTKNKTPPKNIAPSEARDDSTEDDDDDLEAPSPRSTAVVPDSLPLSQPATQPRRFGKIGGAKPVAPPRPPHESNSEPHAKSPKNVPPSDDDTDTEDEDVPLPSKFIPPQRRAASPPVTKSSKGRLGKIGGRKKEPTRPSTLSPDDVAMPEKIEPVVNNSKTPKRSTINKHEDNEEETKTVHETRGQFIAARKEETPGSEELEMERADRKREEMRQELEQKAKAPPKKKRKF